MHSCLMATNDKRKLSIKAALIQIFQFKEGCVWAYWLASSPPLWSIEFVLKCSKINLKLIASWISSHVTVYVPTSFVTSRLFIESQSQIELGKDSGKLFPLPSAFLGILEFLSRWVLSKITVCRLIRCAGDTNYCTVYWLSFIAFTVSCVSPNYSKDTISSFSYLRSLYFILFWVKLFVFVSFWNIISL